MLAELAIPCARPRPMGTTGPSHSGPRTRIARTGPTVADRLARALLELAGQRAAITAHKIRNWASITFAGTRHEVELVFSGQAAIAAGEAFVEALPDHEFAIRRQLVADAAIAAVEQALLPEPQMRVTAQLLLLEEA